MTPIDICNQALGVIGKPPINDFEEALAEARAARRFYNPVRRSILQASNWTFARRRVHLAEVEPNFPERWNHTYTLPHDMLVARALVHPRFDPRFNPRPIPYEIAEGRIFTNLPGAQLIYTVDKTETSAFPALFIDALAAQLAHRFARELTRSTRLTAEMKEDAREMLSNAIASDASQDINRYTYDADATLDRAHGLPHPFWGY